MTWVEGTPLDHGTIARGDHAADMLAAFLTALHVEAPADAPGASDFGTHPKDSRGGFEHFIVDFGALFAGDPAWDLGAAWLLLPQGGAARFFDSYRADEATVRRARGLAAMKCLFLMLMGRNGDRGLPGGKPNWGPAGRSALARVLKDL